MSDFYNHWLGKIVYDVKDEVESDASFQVGQTLTHAIAYTNVAAAS